MDIVSLGSIGGEARSPARRNGASVWIDRQGRVDIGDPPGEEIAGGLAGFRAIVEGGRVSIPAGGPLHPRTAIGLDESRERLWLVVVDGRQRGFSEGMSEHELASLMVGLGCEKALNLDGGGSSVMALAGAGGRLRIKNTPSGRRHGVARVRPLPAILAVRRR